MQQISADRVSPSVSSAYKAKVKIHYLKLEDPYTCLRHKMPYALC